MNANLPIVLLGSGGHARVLLGMLRRGGYEILGITDPRRKAGSDWMGFQVLGDDAAIERFAPDSVRLVNGIGSLPGDGGLRTRLYQRFDDLAYLFETVIDRQSFVGEDVVLAAGVQLMAGVNIQAGTQIAKNTIINSGAIVEHDCRIGPHAHIAPGAVVCGGVAIGERAHVGAGAVVIQGLRVGADSVIGAGAVVTRDVGVRQIVYPARSQIQDLAK